MFVFYSIIFTLMIHFASPLIYFDARFDHTFLHLFASVSYISFYTFSQILSAIKLTLSMPEGGGGAAPPLWVLFSITPKRHKMMKWQSATLTLHFWETFCIHWQCSLFKDVAMAAFCFQCVTLFFWDGNNEETWIIFNIMASSCSNLVERVFLGSEFKFI